VRIFSETANLQ